MLSRQIQFVGLNAGVAKVALAAEEPFPGIEGGYNGVRLHIVADVLNAAVAYVNIQDSPDGTTWTTVLASAPIVPGGEYDMAAHITNKYMRVTASSAGVGKLSIIALAPEEHASGSLWPDAGPGTY